VLNKDDEWCYDRDKFYGLSTVFNDILLSNGSRASSSQYYMLFDFEDVWWDSFLLFDDEFWITGRLLCIFIIDGVLDLL
jgi:hypothetical protein